MQDYKSEVITAVITCLVMFVLFLCYLIWGLSTITADLKYEQGYKDCVADVKQKTQKSKSNTK